MDLRIPDRDEPSHIHIQRPSRDLDQQLLHKETVAAREPCLMESGPRTE